MIGRVARVSRQPPASRSPLPCRPPAGPDPAGAAHGVETRAMNPPGSDATGAGPTVSAPRPAVAGDNPPGVFLFEDGWACTEPDDTVGLP